MPIGGKQRRPIDAAPETASRQTPTKAVKQAPTRPPEQVETVLEDIVPYVGRTGTLTPVAHLAAVKARGGRVIAQDPATAEQGSMPWNALATGCVDLVLDVEHIADALVALVAVPGAAELFGVRRAAWAVSPSAL